MSAATVWRFGDCELDLAQRQFHQRGAKVHLPPKSYEVLAILVMHRASC